MITVNRKINNKGFTLTELLVTVILVAILASYGVYYYSDVVNEGRFNAAKSRLAALGGATARFVLENGTPDDTYPKTIKDNRITGICDPSEIMGVFNCGYAESSLSGFDSNVFAFFFDKNPCNSNTNDVVTVYMVPDEGFTGDAPGCVYFDPESDALVEVNNP